MKISKLLAVTALLTVQLPAMELGTNFWNLKWHKSNDCFQDVRNVTGDNPWNPQFLQEISFFKSLRFMDWEYTNGSPRTEWSQRPAKESPDQTLVAVEWMIDLCNRTSAGMWVCVPHLTISAETGDQPSDYALRLCLLLKTGVDMGKVDLAPHLDKLSTMSPEELVSLGGKVTTPPLNEGLKVYLEYSNETWNGSFKQMHYCALEGPKITGLNPNPKIETEGKDAGKDWIAGHRFHAWAALRAFRAADLVFGVDAPRVVKVLAGQTPNSFRTKHQIETLADPKMNPWGTKATAYALAPYFGNKVKGDAPDAVEQLRGAIVKCAEHSAVQKAVVEAAGLRLIAYEGGQHLREGVEAINRSPEMGVLYDEYLSAMAPYFDHFSHYCHVGRAGPRGAWGAIEYTGQPLEEAPKYAALKAFAEGKKD